MQEEWLEVQDRIEQRFMRLGVLASGVYQVAPGDLFPRLGGHTEPQKDTAPADGEAAEKLTGFWLDTTRAAIKTRARKTGR